MIKCGGTLKQVFISLRMNADFHEMINDFDGNIFDTEVLALSFMGFSICILMKRKKTLTYT